MESAASNGDGAAWVAAYASLANDKRADPEQLAELVRLRIARTPSVDSLYVDVTSEADGTRSRLFLRSLLRYELQQLRKLEDGVGLARLDGSPTKSGTAGGGSSFFSCVFTLVASAMGAGCLSLPHMFRQSGLGLGLILLAVGAALAHATLVVLISCARYTECRSFAELVAFTGRSGDSGKKHVHPVRSRAVDTVISLYGIAAVLIYLILIGDFLVDILNSPYFQFDSVSRRSVIMTSLFIVLPLSLVRSVTKLRFISVFSTTSIALMTMVVFVKATRAQVSGVCQSAPIGLEDPIVWFSGDFWTTLKSFTIAIFAFNAHTNAVPVALALDEPRANRIWNVCAASVAVEFVAYVLIATSGYLTFRSATQQDFIRNYDADDVSMFMVRCMYAVPIIFGIPINLSPAAASIKALLSSILPCGFCPAEREGEDGSMLRASAELLGHAVVVMVVLGSCAALAINNAQVADAIGLFGGLFGTLLCLWWPDRIYTTILGALHPRSLRVPLRLILPVASALGMLAFVMQCWSIFARGTRSPE